MKKLEEAKEPCKKSESMNIDQTLFLMAFGRDIDYNDKCPTQTYLDCQTGDIIWIYENYEAGQRYIANNSDRFLFFPGLKHSKHHEILNKFLDSKWTDDERLREETRRIYGNHPSIGHWKKAIDYKVFRAYEDFKKYQILKMAEKYLYKHGIKPVWK
jgi:hypothetical protein